MSRRWEKGTLSMRFLVASVFIICVTMVCIDAWVDGRIRRGVVSSGASAFSRYVERSIQSHVENLALKGYFPPASKAALATLLEDPTDEHRILQINVWQPNGALAYSAGAAANGARPKWTSDVDKALKGQIVGHFLDYYDSMPLDELGAVPVFKVYAPIYDRQRKNVLAVAEFYQQASVLGQNLTIARRHSRLAAFLLTLGMIGLLFMIVHRGSVLIIDQQRALEQSIQKQALLLDQNEKLEIKLTQAHQDSHVISDRQLKRVATDLHDGPAQLLGLVLLRLHELTPNQRFRACSQSLDVIRSATQDALTEIRGISTGLSLPEIEKMTTYETLMHAVNTHRRRTRTEVEVKCGDLPPRLPFAIRTCLYRGAQEALNNAFRHASGFGQCVDAWSDKGSICLTVSDTGPGISEDSLSSNEDALGLLGLRYRVESLGGVLKLHSCIGQGTSVSMILPIDRSSSERAYSHSRS